MSPTDPSTKVFARRPALTGIATDLAFVVIAVLDVWLVVPEQAPPYSVYLSAASCVALLLRRRFPFTAVVLAVPGFFAGWAQLAAMFALGYLARRKPFHWHMWGGPVWCGCAGSYSGRWPISSISPGACTSSTPSTA